MPMSVNTSTPFDSGTLTDLQYLDVVVQELTEQLSRDKLTLCRDWSLQPSSLPL
jgi:hypothetical protein